MADTLVATATLPVHAKAYEPDHPLPRFSSSNQGSSGGFFLTDLDSED